MRCLKSSRPLIELSKWIKSLETNSSYPAPAKKERGIIISQPLMDMLPNEKNTRLVQKWAKSKDKDSLSSNAKSTKNLKLYTQVKCYYPFYSSFF